MNKKFLSAILFGALMATSAGTFVSCKDYDDDIKNLQTQIDTNKTAIAELQKLVGAGKWVSSISSIENGFTVTMSDGSSVQIKGINGKDGVDGQDGKNGAEWTIGEDGFWYVDGEKTANVAVGKNGENGKNGVSAPSPFIGADGNWVVYSWDAEKGEFVEKATEIPAAGVAAYAVEADGVYTLHIADENGEYQEIVLPATCDSFVVSSPAKGAVEVNVDFATWGTANRNKEQYAKLVAAFPEIANIKKGDKLTQDGELPLIVSPAEVDLDGSYEFALVGMNGKVADIELSDPTEGISSDWGYDKTTGVMTRSAEAEAGLWTLSVTPVYDTKKKEHASVNDAALIVTNAKGISSRTAFVYTVKNNEIKSSDKVYVGRLGQKANAKYAEVIDVLAPIHGENEDKAIFTFRNEYHGKFVLEATSKVQIEKYDITIEGSNLMIGNMPENETEIKVNLLMTALGLNGSTDYADVELTIEQPIAAIELPAKEVTLDDKAQEVRWDVEENLGMSAVEFDAFMAADPQFVVTREADDDEDGKYETKTAYSADINFYNAKGKITKYANENWDNGEAVTFGFDVKADTKGTGATEMWMPETYKVTLIAKKGITTVYAAATELEVSNPEVAISLVPQFTVDGVLHAVGTPNGTTIEYTLTEGLKFDSKVIKNGFSFKDVAFEAYKEAYGEVNDGDIVVDQEDAASVNWVNGQKLVVYPYNEEKAEEEPATADMLGKVREIEAEFALFGNVNNKVTYNFEVLVKSAVYSETPAEYVTIPTAKLTLTLTDNNTEDKVDPTSVDLATITEAVLAYGPQAGGEYSLWNLAAVDSKPGQTRDHKILNSPKKLSDFVVDANNEFVEIDVNDLILFGYSEAEVAAIKLQGDDADPIYIKYDNATAGRVTWKQVLDGIYNGHSPSVVIKGKTEYIFTKALKYGSTTEAFDAECYVFNATVCAAYIEANATATDINLYKIFSKYYSKMAYDVKTETYTAAGKDATGLSSLLKESAKIELVDESGADFVTFAKTTADVETKIHAQLAAGVVMTTKTVDVPMNLVIKDKWGMTMKVPFTVTVKE